ncbi:hypothetical protein BKA66DRAFT_188620 [Pyrenochaeta sp. MPI-SDFR-AT-0127]|nr:hypothetical protein BKA66DRAFT_188620 [Pyrenochaeta sp. MPI-SDFR-AT-0127]
MARRSAGFVSKKAHRKSRGGCLTCKRKKVKCDEAQPACGYCCLRSWDCQYIQDSALASKSPPSDSTSSHTTPLSDTSNVEEVDFNNTSIQIPTWLVPAACASTGQLTLLDHELLHHYRTSTWKAFAARKDAVVQKLHRDFVPQSSLSNPYLLYALLSIAASHSNALSPSKQIEKQALVYRHKTFQEYSKALQNITAENYESVLVTGTFLLALIPPPAENATDEEHLDWMFSLLKMSEGLRVLASLRWAQGIEKLTIYPLICRELRALPPPPTIHGKDDASLCTPVGPLGTTPNHPNPAPTYPHQYPLSSPLFLPQPLMALLKTLVNPASTGRIDLDRQTLTPVFHALSPIFLSLYYYHLNQDFYVRIFAFTSFLMPDFLQLVKQREPRALTLVAWWFALANLVPNGWWVGQCVRGVVGAIGGVIRAQEVDGGSDGCSSRGNEIVIEAFERAERIVETFQTYSGEDAAMSIYEEWVGVSWDEGPKKAEEWEFGQLLDLGALDPVGFEMAGVGISAQS